MQSTASVLNVKSCLGYQVRQRGSGLRVKGASAGPCGRGKGSFCNNDRNRLLTIILQPPRGVCHPPSVNPQPLSGIHCRPPPNGAPSTTPVPKENKNLDPYGRPWANGMTMI